MPSAVIVTYSAARGPQEELADYLNELNYNVLFIRHILPDVAKSSLVDPSQSTALCNSSGSYQLCAHYTHSIGYPYRYLVEIYLSVMWAFRYCPKSDFFFGVGNICAVSGIFIRCIGHCSKVIFYAIDVVPVRFDNYVLNNMYWFLEAVAARFSNIIWNLSSTMQAGRHHNSILIRIFGQAPSVVVPMGALSLISHSDTITSRRHASPTVCFFGNLNQRTGANQLVTIFQLLRAEHSGLRMLVIGDGPCMQLLQSEARECHAIDAMTFYGFVSGEPAVHSILAEAWVALAPYRAETADFVQFADPGKLKAYLAAGLPIVGTRISPTVEILQSTGCAIAVSNIDQLIHETSSLLTDSVKRVRMSTISLEQSRAFLWSNIFTDAMSSLTC